MKRPLKGGRYLRDADTGKLTKTKQEPQEPAAKPAESKPDKTAKTNPAGKGKSK